MNLNLLNLQKKMPSEKIIKLQDLQLEKLNHAKQMIENGNLEKGIEIIEEIAYKEGGIIFNGRTWPLYLAEVLYKNKMYEKCWKYLNAINLAHLDCLDKIRKLQAKISHEENRPKDALYLIIASIYYQYHDVKFIPDSGEIEKILKPYLKKISINIQKEELIIKVKSYINNNSINEKIIKDEIIQIFN